MKLSKIFKDAASLQESKVCFNFPCWAISRVSGKGEDSWTCEGSTASEFTKVFSNKRSPRARANDFFAARVQTDCVWPRDYDIMALCFAAAIMEAEGE